MRALTEFLLREALTLLLDDPTPRNVAQAMGGAHAQAAAQFAESQTEDASEESESQAPFVSASTHRVMMVRATNSAQQLVTLVDRGFSVEAFVSQALVDELRATRRYTSLSPLRGSVVRIENYRFLTPAQCRTRQQSATGAPAQPVSVSTRMARGAQAKMWLYVDTLTVIDDNELAVNPTPYLEEHPAVAKQLGTMEQSALEQRLLHRQGIAVQPAATRVAAPSPAKQFDDQNPLLDEDCEIPEDQERELDAQEGWGAEEAQQNGPTDSQLIAENGPVSGSDSQPGSSGNTIVSSSGNTVVSSSSSPQSPAHRGAKIVVPETEPQALSSPQSQAVPESQDYHFQRENLQKAFIECSDTDSDDGNYEIVEPLAQAQAAPAPSQSQSQSVAGSEKPVHPSNSLSSQATESEVWATLAEPSQAPSRGDSVSVEGTITQAKPASLTAGGSVESVRPDHDEPMTQAGKDSNLASSAKSVERTTEEQEPRQPLAQASDQETEDVDYGLAPEAEGAPEVDAHLSGDECQEIASMSQQDGQPDHWMDTQPTDRSPAKRPKVSTPNRALSPNASLSPADGLNVTQRRKRRRTETGDAAGDSLPLSPQEPTAKAARKKPSPAAAATSLAPNPDMFASFLTRGGSASTRETGTATGTGTGTGLLGISSFNNKSTNAKLRPSKRYQHLLPPFDVGSIAQLIAAKKN